MAKPIQTPEVFQDLSFPAKGLDVSAEYSLQRQGTTPVGTNVRLFESLTRRGRGGSRCGLSKYIAERLPGGA